MSEALEWMDNKKVKDIPGIVALTEDALDLASEYNGDIGRFRGYLINNIAARARMGTLYHFVMRGPNVIVGSISADSLKAWDDKDGKVVFDTLYQSLPKEWCDPEEWRLRDV